MLRAATLKVFCAVLLAMVLLGCAGSSFPGLAGKEARLEAVPPLPDGFVALPSESIGFRSARITTPSGTWVVVFTDSITNIELSLYVITRLALKWYPEEGGAQATSSARKTTENSWSPHCPWLNRNHEPQEETQINERS